MSAGCDWHNYVVAAEGPLGRPEFPWLLLESKFITAYDKSQLPQDLTSPVPDKDTFYLHLVNTRNGVLE